MPSLRTPERAGVALSLLAGVAFSVSPVLVQVAYRHGAVVTGVLAWRYLVAAVLLALVAGRRLRRVSLATALAAFAMGVVPFGISDLTELVLASGVGLALGGRIRRVL